MYNLVLYTYIHVRIYVYACTLCTCSLDLFYFKYHVHTCMHKHGVEIHVCVHIFTEWCSYIHDAWDCWGLSISFHSYWNSLL